MNDLVECPSAVSKGNDEKNSTCVAVVTPSGLTAAVKVGDFVFRNTLTGGVIFPWRYRS
ncbi:unnamed protein product, partial [Amoebophrya sp. A25]|eukprot:GSA25T00007325001.1